MLWIHLFPIGCGQSFSIGFCPGEEVQFWQEGRGRLSCATQTSDHSAGCSVCTWPAPTMLSCRVLLGLSAHCQLSWGTGHWGYALGTLIQHRCTVSAQGPLQASETRLSPKKRLTLSYQLDSILFFPGDPSGLCGWQYHLFIRKSYSNIWLAYLVAIILNLEVLTEKLTSTFEGITLKQLSSKRRGVFIHQLKKKVVFKVTNKSHSDKQGILKL